MDLVPTPLIQDDLISGASPAKTPFPNMGSLMNSFGSTCLWGGVPQFSPRHLRLSKHLTTFLEFEPSSLVGWDEPAQHPPGKAPCSITLPVGIKQTPCVPVSIPIVTTQPRCRGSKQGSTSESLTSGGPSDHPETGPQLLLCVGPSDLGARDGPVCQGPVGAVAGSPPGTSRAGGSQSPESGLGREVLCAPSQEGRPVPPHSPHHLWVPSVSPRAGLPLDLETHLSQVTFRNGDGNKPS